MKMIKNSNSIIHINLLHCLSHADWDWKIKFCAATHQICRMPTNNHLEMQREHVERCRPHWESLLLSHSARLHGSDQPCGSSSVSERRRCRSQCDTTGAIIAELQADLHLTVVWERGCIPVQLAGHWPTSHPAPAASVHLWVSVQICFRWCHSDIDQCSLVCSKNTRYIELWSSEADIDQLTEHFTSVLLILVSWFYVIVTRIVTKIQTRQFYSYETNFSSLWWTNTLFPVSAATFFFYYNCCSLNNCEKMKINRVVNMLMLKTKCFTQFGW